MEIIDATGCVAGRLASVVAKDLLKGKEIAVINAEKAIITGDRGFILGAFKEKVARGDPYHGPFFPKAADRILKRIIRGMIPYKKTKGNDAMKRLKVYVSVPEELKGKEFKKILSAAIPQERKCITLKEISKGVGGKVYV